MVIEVDSGQVFADGPRRISANLRARAGLQVGRRSVPRLVIFISDSNIIITIMIIMFSSSSSSMMMISGSSSSSICCLGFIVMIIVSTYYYCYDILVLLRASARDPSPEPRWPPHWLGGTGDLLGCCISCRLLLLRGHDESPTERCQ